MNFKQATPSPNAVDRYTLLLLKNIIMILFSYLLRLCANGVWHIGSYSFLFVNCLTGDTCFSALSVILPLLSWSSLLLLLWTTHTTSEPKRTAIKFSTLFKYAFQNEEIVRVCVRLCSILFMIQFGWHSIYIQYTYANMCIFQYSPVQWIDLA